MGSRWGGGAREELGSLKRLLKIRRSFFTLFKSLFKEQLPPINTARADNLCSDLSLERCQHKWELEVQRGGDVRLRAGSGGGRTS